MNLNDDDSKEPGFAFIDRVLSTSSGWVIVVAMAPWEKLLSHFENRVFYIPGKNNISTAPRLEVKWVTRLSPKRPLASRVCLIWS